MKYIANPFSRIPIHKDSHVHGWSQYWARVLGAVIYRGDYSHLGPSDTVYLDHGVNFSGSLNLFGGLSDEVASNIANLVKSKAKLVSLDIPMPDYGAILAGRVGKSSTSKLWTRQLSEDFTTMVLNTKKHVDYNSLKLPWLTVGDSHSAAFASAESSICRINGKTMAGLTKIIQDSSVKPNKYIVGMTFCSGSVDVRHHILRDNDPKSYVKRLVDSYIKAVLDYRDRHSIELVEVCAPVPVEFEGRKIPKTGFFLGEPFYGSQKDRSDMTRRVIDLLRKHASKTNGLSFVMPPKNWYAMDPESYAKDIMELGGSFHISPMHYRSTGGW